MNVAVQFLAELRPVTPNWAPTGRLTPTLTIWKLWRVGDEQPLAVVPWHSHMFEFTSLRRAA